MDATLAGIRRRVSAGDLAFAALLALLALAWQVGRSWLVRPFFYLGADGANVASYSAALDHPAAFTADSVLGDPRNFAHYLTIHTPLVRALERLTGDYGSAFVSLLAPHVFVQGLGFFVLGRVLFGSRAWAALLALIELAPVDLPMWMQWGMFRDPLARITLQALLPFLLAASLAARGAPRRWPWIALGSGLLTYVHPVGAPVWGAALWLGLWAKRPAGWSRRRQALSMAGLALGYVAVVLPFAWRFLGGASGSAPGADAVVPLFLPAGYRDVGEALHVLADAVGVQGLLYGLAALAGVALVARLRPADDRALPMVLLWALGIGLVALGLPLLDQTLARARGALPLQYELVRGLRFFVPLVLLLCLWPLRELERYFQRRRQRWPARGMLALGVALSTAWMVGHLPAEPRAALACWSQGRFLCVPAHWPDVAEAMAAVRRHVPPGMAMFSTRETYPVRLRYGALRPLVYSDRDLSTLAYRRGPELVTWYRRWREEERVRTRRRPSERFRAHVEFARSLGARFALLDRTCLPAPPRGESTPTGREDIVWRNHEFALVRLDANAHPADPLESGEAAEAGSHSR